MSLISLLGAGHPYVQVGKGIDTISCPLTMTDIHSLLSRRHQLQLQGRYEETDAMKFELMINGVFVNEIARQWRADGEHTFEKSSEDAVTIPTAKRRYEEDENSSTQFQDMHINMVQRRIEQLLEKQFIAASRFQHQMRDRSGRLYFGDCLEQFVEPLLVVFELTLFSCHSISARMTSGFVFQFGQGAEESSTSAWCDPANCAIARVIG